MIIASDIRREVGKVITGHITDQDAVEHRNVPAYFIREATRDEYLDWIRSNGREPTGMELIMSRKQYFYEISID